MTAIEEHARSIFLAALERPADEWSAFLDQACGDNPELRERVDQLLGAHQAMGSIQGGGAEPPATTVAAITERPGTTIGPYKLLEEIGEGGMGTVWMAQQTAPVKRVVAIKLIKPGMDSKQVLVRFAGERQALALMDHPNIAKVLDAGTIPFQISDFRSRIEPTAADLKSEISHLKSEISRGRPYFVMELVKGVPITRYCDEHRLTPRQRLELFVPVCQAIQHAHQKGVIHRDIKPSNVLVALYDDKPVPKVIDFGVAKATGPQLTEQTLQTGFGAVVGTVEYMSPEQAGFNQLDIDTRSDIYSLGVLLYELLAGSPPFSRKELEKAGVLEMLRVIREDEPSKPSTKLSTAEGLPTLAANRGTEPAKLTKLVRGELDWIVMKALEKDRSRRYETANGLAHDIEHYLHDEPVAAGPPSTAYRFRKFVRRNKGPVLAASLVLLALVIGVIGTTLGLFRAKQQRRIAEENEQKAVAAAEAEKKAKETAETRETETKAVLDFVQNKVFAAARPERQEGGLGREVTLRQAVDAALPFVDKSFKNQPLIEARLRMTLGSSFWYLGDATMASEQFRVARMLFSQHLGPDHADTLSSMNNLANSYSDLGRDTDALKLREETLALRKVKLGLDHPQTLGSMNNLALSYCYVGRYAEALKLNEETLALRKVKLGLNDPNTFFSMHNLAMTYAALGRHADARRLNEETLALRKVKLGPNHPDTLKSMTQLAFNYHALGRYSDALKLNEETLALKKVKLGPNHPDTLGSMTNLALTYAALGRHADALKLHEETLVLQKAKLGRDHKHTLGSMVNLASVFCDLGRHGEALKLYEAALPVMKAKIPDDSFTFSCMEGLANCYGALGRHADALKLHEETLALRKAKLGPDHPDTLMSMRGRAETLAKLDRGAEAVPITDECLKRAAGKVVDPLLIPGVLEVRLRHFEKSKDAAGCRATAEMWEKLNRADADRLYTAARFRAVTAAVIRGTDLKSVLRTKDAEPEADRAMAWLTQAVAAGYKNAAHMKEDKDLDALRDRVDFKKLVAGLDAGKEKKN
jgi:serine/threonine protein kinase/tetratricopeptide (TPR) repeat protein